MRETLQEYELDADTLSVVDMRRYLASVWDELRTPAGREALKREGLSENFADGKFEEVFFVEPSGASLVDPGSVIVGMLLAGAGTVGKDVWKKILLPRLEDRFGKTALKERKKADKKADGGTK